MSSNLSIDSWNQYVIFTPEKIYQYNAKYWVQSITISSYFQFPHEKKLQLCSFICGRDNCICLCRQLLGKLAVNEMSLLQYASCWAHPQPGRTTDNHHERFAYVCIFFYITAVLIAVKDAANVTNIKTLENVRGSFSPAVFGSECEDESLQHLL